MVYPLLAIALLYGLYRHHCSGAEPMVDASDDVMPGETVVSPEQPEPVVSEFDDLTRIRGIGPSIASLLHDNGICTFAQLAETDVEILTGLCRAAKFPVRHIDTWPEQAQLAADDDLQAFDQLTSKLKF